jgi:hypothetical protein
MEFFTDYKNLKCNYEQFEFIKPYLYADGWDWYNGDIFLYDESNENIDDYLDDLVMIQPHYKYEEDKNHKFFIPYYEDEIEYLKFEKDVKEIIREIKLNELL